MKKAKYILSLVVGIIVLTTSIKAQQMPQTNLYTDNIFNINPAYAGYNPTCLEAYLGHITQWVGVEGAPSTNYLDIHKGFGKRFGLGGGFILDQTSMINRFSGNLSGSYRIGLGENSNLRVGLSMGVYQVSINTSDAIVQDPTDELVTGSRSGMTFNNEFGLIYNYKKFIVGVAVPQVLETNASTDAGNFGVDRHFTAFAKYDWEVSEKWSIEPSSMMRNVNNISQFDGNLMATYNNLISIGAGYRTDVGLLARMRLRLQDMFILAYAYEFAGSNISSYSSGSHEIMLGITFCKEKTDEPSIESTAPAFVPEPEPVVEPEPTPTPEPEPVVEPEPTPVPEPEPVVEPVPGPSNEEKQLFNNSFTFGLGSVDMTPSSIAKINSMVNVMKKYPDLKVEVIGHSCDKGSDLRKEVVSTTRAENVKRYMIQKGIESNRITATGVSDSKPTVPNTNDANRSKNRKVEFRLIE